MTPFQPQGQDPHRVFGEFLKSKARREIISILV